MSKQKVYCLNCKYYGGCCIDEYGCKDGHNCKRTLETVVSPLKEYRKYGKCESLNTRNNCGYYEEKATEKERSNGWLTFLLLVGLALLVVTWLTNL